MDSVIYYFSATGNSLKVAKDLAGRLGSTEIIKICKDMLPFKNEKQYKKVGIVFPVYYYGLPVMVREFAEKLEVEKGTYVFTVATCGGSVGASITQLKEILERKAINLSSAFSIVMPDNYQVMYSPPSQEKQQRLFKAEQEKVEYIAEKINNGNPLPFEEENSFAARLLGKPLSKTFKPKHKDKNFWVDENCNGCGICARVCPSNNISLAADKPQWQHDCEHCLACMHWCPKQSLQYKKGTVKRDRYHHPDVKASELFNSASQSK